MRNYPRTLPCRCVCPSHSAFNIQHGLSKVTKSDGSREKIVGYQELNKVLSPIDEIISNIATILDIFSVVLGICNVFFFFFQYISCH